MQKLYSRPCADVVEMLERRSYMAGSPFITGKLGNGITFADDPAIRVDMGDPADNHLDLGTNATIETWVKFTQLPKTGESYAFVSKDEGQGPTNKWIFGYTNATDTNKNKTFFQISDDTGKTSTIYSSAWTPLINSWYHLTVTKDGEVYRLYRDFIQEGIGVSSVQVKDTDASFMLGQAEYDAGSEKIDAVDEVEEDPDADPPVPGVPGVAGHAKINPSGMRFMGAMDDVRVWSTTRTLSQITSSFGVELTGNEAGLLGYWKLNEVAAPAADDATTFDTPGEIITSMIKAGQGQEAMDELAKVPELNSLPGAAATLYLNFSGETVLQWGNENYEEDPVEIDPYDTNGDMLALSPLEIGQIISAWKYVVDAFAPFNINVTTVDPGVYEPGTSVRIDIGGDGKWFNGDDPVAQGVAWVNGFTNPDSDFHLGFAFSKHVSGGGNLTPDDIGLVVAHEAGHTLGLRHHGVWDQQHLDEEYDPGTAAFGPIMGAPYDSNRKYWTKAPTSLAYDDIQDDLAVISGKKNGFGYKADDYGNTSGTAQVLDWTYTGFVGSGIIEDTSDVDVFKFTVAAGTAKITVDNNKFMHMLDPSIEVRTLAGAVVGSADTGLTETLSLNLAAGTYLLYVKSHGSYSDVGSYNLRIVAPRAGVTPPVQTGSISGTVFNDVNGDGVRQGGEVALGNQAIYLDTNGNDLLDSGETTVNTNANGEYTLGSLAGGSYKVRIVVPPNWTRTTAAANVTLATSQTLTGLVIGLKMNTVNPPTTGSISGVVFGDANSNGVYDAGDSVAARVVFIDLNGNNKLDSGEKSVTAGADGKYTFSGLVAGNYSVRREFPAGYTLSSAPINVALAAGQALVNQNIGSKTGTTPPPTTTKGSINGFLFWDSNGNGKYEKGEELQAGKQVFIDLDGDNALDANETVVKTDSKGNFSFGNLAAGNYKIRRVLPGGYKVTTSPLNIGLASGQNVSGVSIGTKPV